MLLYNYPDYSNSEDVCNTNENKTGYKIYMLLHRQTYTDGRMKMAALSGPWN